MRPDLQSSFGRRGLSNDGDRAILRGPGRDFHGEDGYDRTGAFGGDRRNHGSDLEPENLLTQEEARRVEAEAMSEKRLQDAITDAARGIGWYVYHTHIAKRSAEGYPDLTMANPGLGRHLWVELKREAKDGRRPALTPAQVEVLDTLAGVHPEVYIWLPRDWLSGAIAATLTALNPGTDDEIRRTLWANRRDSLGELDIRVLG